MPKISCFLVCFLWFSSAFGQDLTAVPHLDLARYTGKWYEIARLPMKHQDRCIKSEAEYSLKDGQIEVKNRCSLADGKSLEVSGIAKIEDTKSNSKLKVNFTPAWIRLFGIGWADYWVIELGADYDYAVVSEPKKQYLWILSRKPTIKKALYNEITARLSKNGFDLSKLIISGERE